MKLADKWKDYSVIATGDGYKLERWGDVTLLRPDPQVIWPSRIDMSAYKSLNAKYLRSESGGGEWKFFRDTPKDWTINYGELKFRIKPMGFKHTGLFPEQAVNWDYMRKLVTESGRQISVLNLFAYTGGATCALLKAGASVCHVDSAKAMVERAKENVSLCGVSGGNVRFIVDDCKKFVEREIRRGRKYDAIVMDPPSYGRGPNGETWKLESELFTLIELCEKLLSDKPLFFLINSYTTGLQPQVINNVLISAVKDKRGGKTEAYEIGLTTEEKDIILPCGNCGMWTAEDVNTGV